MTDSNTDDVGHYRYRKNQNLSKNKNTDKKTKPFSVLFKKKNSVT